MIYGHFDQGTLIVIDYKADDSSDAAAVTGAKLKGRSYTGADVRFLFPSGRYTLTLIGNGINLSAVGQGKCERDRRSERSAAGHSPSTGASRKR